MNPDSAHHDGVTLADVAYEGDWGPFAAAIARWEQVMGPAPAPTDGKRLSPDFVRWMMGYEPGWVDGIPRTGQLRCLGNAVVPQQALAAFSDLLGMVPPERERERESGRPAADAAGTRGRGWTPARSGRADARRGSQDARMMPTPTARLGDPRGAQAKRYAEGRHASELDDAIAWLNAESGPDHSGPPPSEPPASQQAHSEPTSSVVPEIDGSEDVKSAVEHAP